MPDLRLAARPLPVPVPVLGMRLLGMRLLAMRLLGTLVAAISLAALLGNWRTAAAAETEFLEPEKAFVFSARPLDAKTIEVAFDIAPGYYLYREQFRFDAPGATLGPPLIPPGKVKYDEFFAKNVESYRGPLRITLPVTGGASAFALKVTSQGCADAGLCYSPMESTAQIDLAAIGGSSAGPGGASPTAFATISPATTTPATTTAATTTPATTVPTAAPATTAGSSDSTSILSVLTSGGFWAVVAAFFVAGLLLSLTPCVLPMLPIVSSIIVGRGGYGSATAVSRSRGIALAGAYSLGMAVVYTGLGVAAGLAGEGLAAALQNPWLLGGFAAGMVVLALSMFGVWEFRLPSAFVGSMTQASCKLPAGRTAGVFAMGGVSALIVSPCVAAPLAGAMLYLSQTGDVWLGGTALFSLSAGMSVPLLALGASAGAVLPRAGPWMTQIKIGFGFVMLGMAIWTVSPALPRTLTLFLFGVLAVGAAVALLARGMARMGSTVRRPVWRIVLGVVVGGWGAMQLAGAATGGTDLLQPLSHLAGGNGHEQRGPQFVRVRSVGELDAALARADRPVVLDFYADWCVSCKEMERFTFADPEVRRRLQGAVLLQADVTDNNADDRALLRRFRLFGPPGIIFFDAAGKREIGSARVIGYQKTEKFLATLGVAGL